MTEAPTDVPAWRKGVRAAPDGARGAAGVGSDRPNAEFTARTLRSGEPRSPDAFGPGDRVARFRLREVLGSGGMGVVYRAHDDLLAREVALKVLQPCGKPPGAAPLAALVKEARAAARLDHVNAVRIFDVGAHAGVAFICMELVDGPSLRKLIRSGQGDFAERVGWLEAIAAALHAAHSAGVVHRDVKPENVLIASTGVVKVVDFGIAHAPATPSGEPESLAGNVEAVQGSGPDASGRCEGTPGYMAPEQRIGAEPDGRADQYAWGCVARELLGPRACADSAVKGVLERVTAYRALDRYPTMAEASDALLDALASLHGMGLGGEPSASISKRTELARSRPRSSRMRPTWLLAGCATLGLVGLFTLGRRYVARAETIAVAAPHDHRRETPALDNSKRPLGAQAVGDGAPAGPAEPHINAGLQLWADGASGLALRKFAEAAERDPTDPRPHLLIFAASPRVDPSGIGHAQKAQELHRGLPEVYARLLRALRPSVDVRPNERETTSRLRALYEAEPENSLVQLSLATHLIRGGNPEALTQFAAQLPTGSPVVLWLRARAALLRDSFEEARPLLEACVEQSPQAYDCLQWLGLAYTNAGACEAAVEVGRRMVAASPSQPEGYLVLGRGVYGTTRSTDAVRTLIQERLRRTGENADEVRSSYEFSLAVLDGDFTGALANSTKLEAAVAPLADARRHGLSLMELFEVHFELGESAQARRVAEKFRDLAVTWRPDSYFDSNIESARLLYLSNAITADELERLRTKAMGAQHEVGFIHSSLMTQWLDNYVQTIVSPKDALAAEQARPPNAYADYLGHEGNIDASLGHMQLLRGHYAEAIALLSSAGSSCSVLAHPFWYVRSKLWLGDAFEAVGQHEEACAQFQAVIYHWGNEPRSVSAAAARRRLAKCTTARFERNRP